MIIPTIGFIITTSSWPRKRSRHSRSRV